MRQGVFIWSGHGWTPKRGLHADVSCSECGEQHQIMYERDNKTFCEEHKPAEESRL